MATVVVTGSSGLIGTALVEHLTARGDAVVRLVRRDPAAPGEVRWDPSSRRLDPAVVAGADAVVNLAGAGIGDHRWTSAYRREIIDSRVDATHAVATAIAETGGATRLVSASAIGFYGSRGEEELTEESVGGEGFTAEVVRAWESAAEPAVAGGASVAFVRSGLVLGSAGGALARMLPLARLGLGGPLGSGRQWWPWITVEDEVRAIAHLLDTPDLTGPVNAVGPHPARQREIASALGAALHRPAVLPAPSVALRVVLGGFAAEVLDSHRVLPRRLEEAGFAWSHPDLPTAMRWLVTPA